MNVRTYCLMLFFWVFSSSACAIAPEPNILTASPALHQSLTHVYYQTTEIHLPSNAFIAKLENIHAFNSWAKHQKNIFAKENSVWFLTRLQNNSNATRHLFLEYDFPMADKFEIYQSYNDSFNFQLINKAGADTPFHERALPFKNYVTAISIEAYKQLDLLIRVNNATFLPNHLTVSDHAYFLEHSLKNYLLEGFLLGILCLHALYHIVQFIRIRHNSHLFYSGFLISFALLMYSFNGIAFFIIWPNYPEINQGITLLAAGTTLLCLNLSIKHALAHLYTPALQKLSAFSHIILFFLVFSPLFVSENIQFILLFIAFIWVLSSNIVLAMYFALRTKREAYEYIFTCAFTLISISLLNMNQAGYLNAAMTWIYFLQLLMLIGLALISFSLQKLTPIKSNEQALLKKLTKEQSEFEESHTAMLQASGHNELIKANPAYLKMLGYHSQEELKHVIEKNGMWHFSAIEDEQEQIKNQLLQTKSCQMAIQGQRSDNTTFLARVHAKILTSDDYLSDIIHIELYDLSEIKTQINVTKNNKSDALSTLYTQFYFEQQLAALCKKGDEAGCLLHINLKEASLDQGAFALGAQELLLKQLSNIFKRIVSYQGSITKLTNEQFVILLPNKNASEAFSMASLLLEGVKQFRFAWQENQYPIFISIGIAVINGNKEDASSILNQAISASKLASEKGFNRIHLFKNTSEETA